MLQQTGKIQASMIGGEACESHRVVAGDAACGLILLCDHARNWLPQDYGSLGLPASQFSRHIAYDIGAEAVTLGIAERLGAPAVLSNFSRLLIDPNRGEDDPTLIMRLSDGAVVPGNAETDADERARRIARFHRPYHDAIGRTIERALAAGVVPALLSVHSFTPAWKGVVRKLHAGVLTQLHDKRFAEPLIAELKRQSGLIVMENEPYNGELAGDTLDRHAKRRGLASALLEIRQDLIGDEAGVTEWIGRLCECLPGIAERRELHSILDQCEQDEQKETMT